MHSSKKLGVRSLNYGGQAASDFWQDFGTKEESSRLVSEHFEVQASSQLVSEVFKIEVQVPTSKGEIPKDTSKFKLAAIRSRAPFTSKDKIMLLTSC